MKTSEEILEEQYMEKFKYYPDLIESSHNWKQISLDALDELQNERKKELEDLVTSLKEIESRGLILTMKGFIRMIENMLD